MLSQYIISINAIVTGNYKGENVFFPGFLLFQVCLRSKYKYFNPERSEGLK